MPTGEIPLEFTSRYYDEDYFKTPKGKQFHMPNGTISKWGYENETGEWLGAEPIAKAWKTVFKPKNILDVGAGRGTFIAYARDFRIEAEGFDYSEWAVNEGRYPRCKSEWLRHHDARDPWPYTDRSFDLVILLDFFEHLYYEDLESIIKEMYRVTGKWIFMVIATVGGRIGDKHKPYILKKGEPIPLELEEQAVAGHVTVQSEQFWIDLLDNDDWRVRRDVANWFCSLVEPKIISNWTQNSIIVLERLN